MEHLCTKKAGLRSARRLVAYFVVLSVLVAGCMSTPPARQGPATAGFMAKMPVVAAACANCPWGSLADTLKRALQPTGYDLQVCHRCSGPNNPRYVAEARLPPAPTPGVSPDDGPLGPVDFGITNLHRVWWARDGIFEYAQDGPRPNLRAIAMIEQPSFILVAVSKDSGITDLAEIRRDHRAVRILANDQDPYLVPLLDFYGLDRKSVESWGGSLQPVSATNRDRFDVLIHSVAFLGNAPEAAIWTEASQRHELRFLAIPDAVRDALVAAHRVDKVDLPPGLLRGADKPVATVGRSGQVVYGRVDMPEDFAYLVARTLDEHRHDLIWSNMAFSYDSRTVWRALNIPLHPGAARYYRHAGYMK